MIVRCISTTGEALSQKALASGNLSTSRYPLEVGGAYNVYAISIWRGTLYYLVHDQSLPNWYPAELFEVVDHLLPLEWYYQFFKDDQRGLEALWGYREMIFEVAHYVNLIERESEAIQVFLKRKHEIDEV